ncbi:bromodomain-containing protein 9 [Planoprotostelium fungivorum]|uniref:Bromodomain-containing protein 9 n=1 Tax=Planoprotostelium fungivorum TaxID=1890364 RepID=A0A2P6NMY6_9EUKA|nr:bromodomain-containing protein 9 [Planoprotostelium fungivorum]
MAMESPTHSDIDSEDRDEYSDSSGMDDDPIPNPVEEIRSPTENNKPPPLKLVLKLRKQGDDANNWSIIKPAAAVEDEDFYDRNNRESNQMAQPSIGTPQPKPTIKIRAGQLKKATDDVAYGTPVSSNKRKRKEPTSATREKSARKRDSKRHIDIEGSDDEELDIDESDDDMGKKKKSRSKSTPKRAPSKLMNLDKALQHALQLLIRKDTMGFFFEPVSIAIAPDYYQVITRPMDFTTMKNKLSAGKYSTLDELKEDFVLLCNNCMTYNRPETLYNKEAKKLMGYGVSMIEGLKGRVKPAAPPTPEIPTPSTTTATPKPIVRSHTTPNATTPNATPSTPTTRQSTPQQNTPMVTRGMRQQSAVTPIHSQKATSTIISNHIQAKNLLLEKQKANATRSLGSIKTSQVTPTRPVNVVGKPMMTPTTPPSAPSVIYNPYVQSKTKEEPSSITPKKFQTKYTTYTNSVSNYLNYVTKQPPTPGHQPPVRQPLTQKQIVQAIGTDNLNAVNDFMTQLKEKAKRIEENEEGEEAISNEEFNDIMNFLTTSPKQSTDTESEGKKIQEQLDKNAKILYHLQMAQYDRAGGPSSDKENKLAVEFSQNLIELVDLLPPSVLVNTLQP